tara:strand:+ start:28 stop:1545 length:1518 start_codon:yes stop_codon:yes gene_type:complete
MNDNGAPTNTIDDVLREVNNLESFLSDRVDERIETTVEEIRRMAEAMEGLKADLVELRRESATKIMDGARLIVPDGRMAGLDALDLSIYKAIVRQRAEHREENRQKSVEMLAAADEASTRLKDSLSVQRIFDWSEKATSARLEAAGLTAPPASMMKFREDLAGFRGDMIMNVHKAMDSTTAGTGDELVPTFEAAQLWMDVNLATVVLPVMRQFPMPTQPFRIPTQLGDTNWYPSVENVQALTSDLSTARVTLDAKGLVTGVPFSDELEEDAIIALIPAIRASLVRNASEVIDDVLLNADQTAANGINSDGATINTQSAGKAHWLLGFDGLIHLPLVDNTGQAVDHNAAVTADGFNEVLSKLGKYAAPSQAGDVVYISDVNTAIRSLSITEFETVDVAGARNTLSTGEIMNVYGKPYLHTSQIRLADADGKVTDSGNAENNGRILALNTTQWAVGFRRGVRFESAREAGKSQTTLYVTLRLALTERSGTRSTATHTSLLYNITGVA